MKNKLFLTALLMVPFFAVTAQQTVYSQNFEGNVADIWAEGWQVIGFNGDISGAGVFNPSPSIQQIGFTGKTIGAATFNIVNQVPTHINGVDSALRSPAITLHQGESTLTFRVGSVAIGGNATSHYSVYVVPTQDLAAINSNAGLKSYLDGITAHKSATISGQSSVVTCSISSFAQQSVTAIFRLHDSPTNTFLLFDDITVTSGILSTPNVAAAQFAIAPNPASGHVTVTSPNGAAITAITLHDLNGRLLGTTQYNGQGIATADVSKLAAGVFLMTITSDEGSVTKKIVKQ